MAMTAVVRAERCGVKGAWEFSRAVRGGGRGTNREIGCSDHKGTWITTGYNLVVGHLEKH